MSPDLRLSDSFVHKFRPRKGDFASKNDTPHPLKIDPDMVYALMIGNIISHMYQHCMGYKCFL
jgi:hypothetical protein